MLSLRAFRDGLERERGLFLILVLSLVISSGHFLYSYNPVLDICSWPFLGCFPFPKFLLLESSLLVPILCLTSAPLLFTVFRTQKNATPSSFLCKTLIIYFPSENPPLSVCVLSPILSLCLFSQPCPAQTPSFPC